MTLQVDFERVRLAAKAVRAELLTERSPAGHWVGEVVSSPLATATAISALVTAHETDESTLLAAAAPSETAANQIAAFDDILQSHLSEVIVEGLHWLARYQNVDGGWGDATGARSNLHATLLVQAAFRLTGVPARYADLMDRADEYVTAQGGIASLRYRFGKDRLVIAPVLVNCALAGMVPWRQVPTLPFEWACLSAQWSKRLRLPVDPLEIPVLVAAGQAKFHHDPPRNPFSITVRNTARGCSLSALERLQAHDGSFFDAVPISAFVVMGLASAGRQRHSIVQHGVEFLLSTMRSDASWPVVTNLAVTNTCAALESFMDVASGGAHFSGEPGIGSIAGAYQNKQYHQARKGNNGWHTSRHNSDAIPETALRDDTVSDLPVSAERSIHPPTNGAHVHEVDSQTELDQLAAASFDWLLNCQSDAGGWGWNDSPGALPNCDDTAGALLTLARIAAQEAHQRRQPLEEPARFCVQWLLDLQNEDGGWPPFQRGPGAAFSASGPDITAHVLQALTAWRECLPERIDAATERGLAYLSAAQAKDGSFTALRFGNQHHDDSENPVCGTARVLAACAALRLLDGEMAVRARRWLVAAQHSTGGWGPRRLPRDYSSSYKTDAHSWRENELRARYASVEETSIVFCALLPLVDADVTVRAAVANGLAWLTAAVERDEHHRPAVIGNFLTKVWYHDRLLPLTSAAGALSRALQLAPQQTVAATANSSR